MKLKICLLTVSLALMLFVPTACSITIGDGTAVSINDISSQAAGAFTAYGDDASTVIRANGLGIDLDDTHWVEDILGNHAEVGLSVDEGDVINYRTRISPREGNLFLPTQRLSAEEFVTVENAKGIEAHAEAWRNEGVANEKRTFSGISIKGGEAEPDATLTGYSNLAYVTISGEVGASQKVLESSGETVDVLTKAIDGDQRSWIEIEVSPKTWHHSYGAEFDSGSTEAVAGASTKVVLDGHIWGNLEVYPGTSSLPYLQYSGPAYGVEYKLHSEAETNDASTSLINELGYCIDDDRWETIQEAVDDVLDDRYWHNTVYLAPGEYVGAIIDKSVDVIGSGSDLTKVTGSSRVFTIGSIDPTVNVNLADMTITKGHVDALGCDGSGTSGGGGIWNGATLTVENSKISDNYASDGGGGIWNNGDLTVIGSTISDNTADDKCGGGINNRDGKLTVIDSIITRNSAGYCGGGIRSHYGIVNVIGSTISDNYADEAGGGIASYDDEMLVVDSTISGNEADQCGGGGIQNRYSKVTAIRTEISDNTGYGGGGIKNMDDGYTEVIDSIISGNEATNCAGGGINNEAEMKLIRTNIVDNKAVNGGGGGIKNKDGSYMEVIGSTISGNEATGCGGGINNEGEMKVTDTTISGNKAGTTGGGIKNMDDAKMEVTGSTISYNTAVENGGGILNDGALTLIRSNIMFNTAGLNGGGIYNDGDLTRILSWVLFNRPNNIFSA